MKKLLNILKTKIIKLYTQHWPIYTLIIFTIIFFFCSSYLVSYYYANGLPYYDSVGAYWNMFHIMNTTRNYGLIAGINLASGYPLSWIQSFYAVIVAFILPNTPAALVSLNFILLTFTAITIYWCLKSAGYSKLRSFILGFLPLLPGVLMEWEGGFVDMRREASFIMLLTTIFFIAWIYLWKKRKSLGIVLGIFIGLCQWSRGNSLPYILMTISSIFIVWFILKRERRFINNLKILVLPVLTSLIFILPFYYFNIQNIITKYVFSSWEGGINRLVSLIKFGYIPLALFSGVNRTSIKINFFVLALIFLSTILLLRFGYFRINYQRKNKKPSMLLISGILLFILVFLFNVLVLGVGKFVGAWPFFPMIVGAMAILGGMFFYVKPTTKIKPFFKYKNIGLLLLMFFILIFSSVRIYYSMPLLDKSRQPHIIQASKNLKNILGGKTVTYFWLDHVHVHDLNFYITREGGLPIRAGSIIVPGIDTEMYPIKNKPISEQQTNFYEALKTREFVVITEDLHAYEDDQSLYFILRYGKSIVSELLTETDFKRIFSFDFGERKFTVLKNKAYEK